MAKKKPAESNQTNFEDAMSELETIVRRLEQGGESLEEALSDYSNAIGLMKTCHKKLKNAERRIEVLSGVDAQGNPIVDAIDDSEISLEEKREARSARRSAKSSSAAGKPTSAAERSTEGELF